MVSEFCNGKRKMLSEKWHDVFTTILAMGMIGSMLDLYSIWFEVFFSISPFKFLGLKISQVRPKPSSLKMGTPHIYEEA